MKKIHKVKTVVLKDGIVLDGLPGVEGDEVEVAIQIVDPVPSPIPCMVFPSATTILSAQPLIHRNGCVEVILLDTHIWFWWVHEDMTRWDLIGALDDCLEGEELVVSVISCWEIAKPSSTKGMTWPDLDEGCLPPSHRRASACFRSRSKSLSKRTDCRADFIAIPPIRSSWPRRAFMTFRS